MEPLFALRPTEHHPRPLASKFGFLSALSHGLITASGALSSRSRRCRCRRAGSDSHSISVGAAEVFEFHVTATARGPQVGLADSETFAELLCRQPLFLARRAFEFGYEAERL